MSDSESLGKTKIQLSQLDNALAWKTVYYPFYVMQEKPCVPPWLNGEMSNIDRFYFLMQSGDILY